MRDAKTPSRSERPKLAEIAISDIDLPENVHLAQESLSAPLEVADELALIAMLLRPPMLVRVNDTNRYRAVGNIRALEWQMQIAAARSTRKPTVTAVVLPESMTRYERLVPRIQHHLVPLILEELSTRKAGTARRKLREAGIGSLRRSGARTQLQSLASRSR